MRVLKLTFLKLNPKKNSNKGALDPSLSRETSGQVNFRTFHRDRVNIWTAYNKPSDRQIIGLLGRHRKLKGGCM